MQRLNENGASCLLYFFLTTPVDRPITATSGVHQTSFSTFLLYSHYNTRFIHERGGASQNFNRLINYNCFQINFNNFGFISFAYRSRESQQWTSLGTLSRRHLSISYDLHGLHDGISSSAHGRSVRICEK
jgi:hypothetical protein